jgi:hypothetical protein
MATNYSSLQAQFPDINPAYFQSYLQGKQPTAADMTYFAAVESQKATEASLTATYGSLANATVAEQRAIAAAVPANTPPPIPVTPVPATTVASSPAPVSTAAPAGPQQQWSGYSGGRGSRGGRGGSGGGWSGGSRGGRGGRSQPQQQAQLPQPQETYIPGFSLLTTQEAAQLQAGQSIAELNAGLGYYARSHGLGQTRSGRGNRGSRGGSGSGSSNSGFWGSASYYGAGPAYQSGYGGAQPVTMTDQGTTLTQEGYLEELQNLYGSSAATALSTAESVPLVEEPATSTDWLTENTIFSSVPNWVVLAGGAAILWFLMGRRR